MSIQIFQSHSLSRQGLTEVALNLLESMQAPDFSCKAGELVKIMSHLAAPHLLQHYFYDLR